MSDLTGKLVAGYPIQRLVYRGPYSDVYQAASSGAPLAIKVLRDELRGDPGLNTQIARGWDTAKVVQHANLATVFNTGNDPAVGVYCLAELVEGKSLRQMILGGPKIAWRDCLILAEQLFSAIQAMHIAGHWHGEIWSGNILITQDQDLKLEGGGGIAAVDRAAMQLMQGPATGYLAPELIQGTPPSPESDIYSAGACLYFILVGQDPYPGDDADVIGEAVLTRRAAPVTVLRDDLPPEAEEFVARLMAKDPTQRYGLAADVVAEIARLKNSQPLAPLKGGKPAAAPRMQRRAHADRPKSSAGSLLQQQRASVSGLRPGTTGRPGSGIVPGTTSKVFGRLDTHVKSTIPQSEPEKRGDDYFRQGQLPLALNCWRDAFENHTPHAALKIKIELGERELKKEAYSAALDEAKHRQKIGDFKAALNRAQEAMLNAENDLQRNEAVHLESEILANSQRSQSGNTLKIAAAAGAFFGLSVILFYFMGGPPKEPVDTQPLVVPVVGPVVAQPAVDTQRAFIPVANATLRRPGKWIATKSGDLRVDTPEKETAVTMRMVKSGEGSAFAERRIGLLAGGGLERPAKFEERDMLIDFQQATELAFRYGPQNERRLRYFFLINGPKDALLVAEFDGREILFTPELQGQVHEIMNSMVFMRN